MKALYFGTSDRQLYGVFHPASDDASPRRSAVVLAYPWMAEYNMSHWAFRKLASMLARDGFPVLRFDYYGTGDSAGDASQSDVSRWSEDVAHAAREVLELSGLTEVCLVGKGLGAAAALSASRDLPVRDVVLWDPVVSGKHYLRKLDGVDAGQRRGRLYPRLPRNAVRDELLGFAVPHTQRDLIAAVDLTSMEAKLAGSIVIVSTDKNHEHRTLLDQLQRKSQRARLEEAAESAAGLTAAEGENALLASASLTAISSAIAQGEAA